MSSWRATIWPPLVDEGTTMRVFTPAAYHASMPSRTSGGAAVERDLGEPAVGHESGDLLLLPRGQDLPNRLHLVFEACLDPVVLVVGQLDVAREGPTVHGGGRASVGVDAGRHHVADEEARVLSLRRGQVAQRGG